MIPSTPTAFKYKVFSFQAVSKPVLPISMLLSYHLESIFQLRLRRNLMLRPSACVGSLEFLRPEGAKTEAGFGTANLTSWLCGKPDSFINTSEPIETARERLERSGL
jgi:hypothetical protein